MSTDEEGRFVLEAEWLQWIYEHLPHSGPGVLLGVGHDGAVLDSQPPLAIVADMILDGVHFRLSQCGAAAAGRKALAVNLSDLAAMAARPTAAFVTMALPRDRARSLAEQVLLGMQTLADAFAVCIAGGDTNLWDGPLVLSVTACGQLDGPAWTRTGARPGDRILVTGPLGGSLQGKHLDFVPRIQTALQLRPTQVVRAAIDISDGLTLDLARMLRASGCGACLQLQHVPLSAAALQLAATAPPRSALERALGDGEDFELILAVAPEDVATAQRATDTALIDIGCFVEPMGLWVEGPEGRTPLTPQGYLHGGTPWRAP